ncbi:enoyl-CoA hydratase/isomerase family protein [Curvivirga sp.]|uniref:enoyl-CoA hydratase/isomerase family protein n=1 Tax=Curvivirga sp. TaxID=2856848 RepID=UPI003B5C6B44
MPNIIREEVETGIIRLGMNRKPVNAMTPGFLQELAMAYKEVEADGNAKALIIGSDLAVLSAGVDLKEAVHFSKDDQVALVKGLHDFLTVAYGLKMPVICECAGAAIAGGFFFVLTADYTAAIKGANFALAEAKVGVNFPTAPLEVARHALTPPALRYMMLSGEFISTEKALAWGIIDEEVEGDRNAVKAAALKAAKRYAKLPSKTYGMIKTDIRGECVESIIRDTAANKDGTADGWFNEETVPAMNAMIAATQKA